ncbi:MAG: ATP-binding cassette domain-containing protein [Arenicellales bacterium]|jgi:ABC-2 type transport system ATP-binding protein
MELPDGIKVSNLSFNYGDKPVLAGASFQARAGKFTGLLGPNGAGKSTLLSLLIGLLGECDGEISISGIDMRKHPRQALARVGIVFQQSALDLDLTIEQNMVYGAALRGWWGSDARRNINQALELMNIADRGRDKVRDLNGGHRRRLEIARALVHQPAVLILDEPTVGLDIRTRNELVAHVHQLTTSENITVLWASHLVDEIRESDDLVVLHEGQVRTTGPVNQLLRQHTCPTVLSLFERLTGADENLAS